MDTCSGSELGQLEAELASAVAQAKEVLDPGLVDAAQAAFERYAQSECDAATFESVGGTIHPLEESICQIHLTIERIQQVRSDMVPPEKGGQP